MRYDPSKAAQYWGKERLEKARNPLAAVLSFSQPDSVNVAYDAWETAQVLNVLSPVNGKRMADVACGVGRLAVKLASAGAEVEAIDIAAGMLAHTQQAAAQAGLADRVHTHMGMATALPLTSASCDAAVCAGLMEHLPHEERQRCLEEIRRILRPGGTLALVINNAHSQLLSPSADNPYRVGIQYESGYFCQLVEPPVVMATLEALGFEVKKVAANLQYSKARHWLMQHPDLAHEGPTRMAEALAQDLGSPLHPGEDELFADHFVLECKLPSA